MRPGDVLADRYELIDLLDESGGASFWRAGDRVLARPVAVHVLSPQDPRAQPLVDAARSSAAVVDRHLLRVLDAALNQQSCYIVSEWGEGLSLDNLLAAEDTLSPRRAAWLVSEVGVAIAAAHAAGIVHGRLLPENLLVDRTGSVRVIGLAIDAAMHGVRPAGPEGDVRDLVGLLYAGLTGRWPAGTGAPSVVPEALMEADRWLRPRQVRAGIPRVLDDICDTVLNGTPNRLPWDLTTAAGVTDALAETVGDPAGLAAAEAVKVRQMRQVRAGPTRLADPDPERAAPPDLPDPVAPARVTGADAEVPVVRRLALPTDTAERERISADRSSGPGADPDLPDEATARLPVTGPAPSAGDSPATSSDPAASAASAGSDARTDPGEAQEGERTQAGMPIFDDESGESHWFATERRPPPPPPALPDLPPARPLFAPDPPEGEPVRVARRETEEPSAEFWPWGEEPSGGLPVVDEEPVEEHEEQQHGRPGRRLLQFAALVAVIGLLLLAVAFAFKLGRGDSDPTDDPTNSTDEAAAIEPSVLEGLTATDLDPQVDPPEEYPELTGLAVDGDPQTFWRTSTYTDQLGPPPGLKTGVGLVVDLGASFDVDQVRVTFVGAPAQFGVYVGGDEPDDPSLQEPQASYDGKGRQAVVNLPDGSAGRYVTIWLTALPQVEDGFRAQIGEVQVSA